MVKEKIAGHLVEIYDSIDELPILRFHKYNKYMLIDSGVGGDLRDINTHIGRIQEFLKKDPSLASKEIENLRQNMFMISQEMSPKYLAFSTLVKSIDGVKIYDLSDKNLKEICEKLSTEKVSTFEKIIENLKKKLTLN